MTLRAIICGCVLLTPVAALGQALDFPAFATPVAEKTTPRDSYFLATAPFNDGPLDGITAEGAIRQQSWRLRGSLTTLQILAPLRTQLKEQGFTTLYECESRVCGGFDFRFQIDVLPEPDMHVNLGDYRYLAARRPLEDGAEFVSLIVSRSANAGFVQLTRISPPGASAWITASTKAPPPESVPQPGGAVGKQLELTGRATLDDLFFETGSSDLGEQEFASLTGLASFLNSRPDWHVVLVGHTDTDGALDANIALSRRRAIAVMNRLVDSLGVDAGQVAADGVGFLAPRASNLTEEGRALNRRVEVILSSTD